jgi:hypothetical protein
MKNKIKNCSYFTKRLRDNNFVVWKIFDEYNIGDPRRWTILVNPGMESVYITCYVNDEVLDYQPSFAFDDAGVRFKNNMRIRTLSMEVIMTHLIEHGVTPDSNLYKREVNNNEHE